MEALLDSQAIRGIMIAGYRKTSHDGNLLRQSPSRLRTPSLLITTPS
ncbi:hypothetical protein DH86_00001130 [Scytalidium sp. 3C]|nr:hypothetical protein DH86_00001130 [Scytalidium sp. 3C]